MNLAWVLPHVRTLSGLYMNPMVRIIHHQGFQTSHIEGGKEKCYSTPQVTTLWIRDDKTSSRPSFDFFTTQHYESPGHQRHVESKSGCNPEATYPRLSQKDTGHACALLEIASTDRLLSRQIRSMQNQSKLDASGRSIPLRQWLRCRSMSSTSWHQTVAVRVITES